MGRFSQEKAPENSRWPFLGSKSVKKWVIIPFCMCSKILGEAGKHENFTTNAPKILDLKSSSEQIFSRKLQLGAPGIFHVAVHVQFGVDFGPLSCL